jgi:tripartite-type tricarboxylate transporter receptor subunit TctC
MNRLHRLLLLTALATAQPALQQAVAAEKYPARPIRMIAPFTAGSTLDIFARVIADTLGAPLGETIVVDNRAGANGVIGAELVAKAPPDGYTMLLTTGSFTGNIVFRKQLPYDGQRDFAPITQVAQSYGLVLVTNKALPAHDVKELVALAKSKPGKLTYASSGFGNITHVVAEMLKSAAGIDLVHVPYKGSGPALTDVIAGQVDMTFVSTVAIQSYIKDGRVRPIALTGSVRAPVLPDVPTFKEEGLPQVEMTGWYGLWFPAHTPAERIDRIQGEIAKAVKSPRMHARLNDFGLVAVGSTPAEFAKFLKEDLELQSRIQREAHIPKQ